MTTNFTGHEPAASDIDNGAPLFSATPVWDRKRKSTLFGTKKTAAPRRISGTLTPSQHRAAPAADATITPSMLAADQHRVSAPSVNIRPVKARSAGGASAMTMAAVIGAVGVLGATGWFITRDNDRIPELASEPTASVVAATPVQSEAPMIVAETTATPRLVTSPRPRTTPAPRARPAVSAADTGVNVGATLPDAPQAYTTLNPAAAAQPVIASPPALAETAPVAPEVILETPVIAPATETPDATTPPT